MRESAAHERARAHEPLSTRTTERARWTERAFVSRGAVRRSQAELAARPDASWNGGTDRAKAGSATLDKALVKAREQGLFIGLSWEWLQQS